MNLRHSAASRRRGSAKTWLLVALIFLVAVLVPVGLYIVGQMSFTNGTTGGTAAVPDPASPVSSGENRLALQPQTAARTGDAIASHSRTMDLLVIDLATQQPIPGMMAVITARDGFSGRTGVDGHVRIPLPTDGRLNYFNIRVSGKNYVPKRLYWSGAEPLDVGSFPSSYTMAMEQGTRIHGKIVDDAGQPVAGATIILRFNKRFSNQHEQIAAVLGNNRNRPTKSDAAGDWSFPGAPSNCDEIIVEAWDYQHVIEDRSKWRPFTPVYKLYDGSAIITLRRGITVSGTVVEPQGMPLTGIPISIGEGLPGNAFPPETTDASGHFSYHFDTGRTVMLGVQVTGYAPQLKRVLVGAASQTVTIQLTKPHRIFGKVVDASGAPVANARLTIQSWLGTTMLDANFQADAGGNFHWDEAPADPIIVDVRAQDMRPLDGQVLMPDQENIIKFAD